MAGYFLSYCDGDNVLVAENISESFYVRIRGTNRISLESVSRPNDFLTFVPTMMSGDHYLVIESETASDNRVNWPSESSWEVTDLGNDQYMLKNVHRFRDNT